MICSTCGGTLRNGASFCAVCGTPEATPVKAKRTKWQVDLIRVILIACVVLLSIPMLMFLMSVGCWMLL